MIDVGGIYVTSFAFISKLFTDWLC